MQIVDKDGQWFINTALYRFAHAARNSVVFDPQMPVKIKADDWIKGQPLIVACSDPTTGEDMPKPIQPGTVLRDSETKEPVQGDPAAQAAQTANNKLNGKK